MERVKLMRFPILYLWRSSRLSLCRKSSVSSSMVSDIVASTWVVDARTAPRIPGSVTMQTDISGTIYTWGEKVCRNERGGDIRHGERTEK